MQEIELFIVNLICASFAIGYLYVLLIWIPKKCFRIAKKIWYL